MRILPTNCLKSDEPELQAKEKQSRIYAIAQEAMAEFAAALVLAGITLPFVATFAEGVILFAGAAAVVAVNALFRAIVQKKLADSFCSKSFSIFSTMTGDTVIHESGHALAVKALYQNGRPSIYIVPFQGGGTEYFSSSALTRMGEKLGETNTKIAIKAAGGGFAILYASSLVLIAHNTKDTHPKLSLYLNTMAVTNVVSHSLYALSALCYRTLKMSHDFVFLAQAGIHPVAAAVTMAAIPILVKISLIAFDRIRRPTQIIR